MRFIRTFLNREISYFKKLHQEAQRLLVSSVLFNLISPIFGIFVNAFLWRQSQDMILVALFNLIFFGVIPIAFYLNGFLLRKFAPNVLCYTALGIEGIVVASLIFLSNISYEITVIFGILYGLTAGFYWANRNLLKLKTTQSHDRFYFTSIEAASSNVTGVFVPLFIGWLITFGSIIHFYTPLQGYRIVAFLMLLIIGITGIVMHGHSVKHTTGKLLLKNAQTSWQRLRIVQFFIGLGGGMSIFVPTLMVLILVGNEATLGTIQSLSAIIASLIVYILAKYLRVRHRVLLFSISAGLVILGGSIFGYFYSALAVAVFFALMALAQPFIWMAISSLNLDLIDKETGDRQYAYVADQEIYLNGGRVVGILLFITGIHFFSSETALRYTPLFMGLSQLIIIFFAKSTEKHHAKVKIAPAPDAVSNN
jgi:MFS transporter, YQGE family, putative transporter